MKIKMQQVGPGIVTARGQNLPPMRPTGDLHQIVQRHHEKLQNDQDMNEVWITVRQRARTLDLSGRTGNSPVLPSEAICWKHYYGFAPDWITVYVWPAMVIEPVRTLLVALVARL
jgi:hypothetical protein